MSLRILLKIVFRIQQRWPVFPWLSPCSFQSVNSLNSLLWTTVLLVLPDLYFLHLKESEAVSCLSRKNDQLISNYLDRTTTCLSFAGWLCDHLLRQLETCHVSVTKGKDCKVTRTHPSCMSSHDALSLAVWKWRANTERVLQCCFQKQRIQFCSLTLLDLWQTGVTVSAIQRGNVLNDCILPPLSKNCALTPPSDEPGSEVTEETTV